MSDIYTALYDRMVGFAGITALVSTRIFRLKAQDNCPLPFVTVKRLNATRDMTIDGDWGLVEALFYIDIFAETEGETESIGAQILLCLNGLKGVFSGVDIKSILSDDEGDSYEAEVAVFRKTLSFYVTYKER